MDINRAYPFPMPSPPLKNKAAFGDSLRDNDGTIILYEETTVLSWIETWPDGEIPMISTMEVVAEVAWKSNHNFW